MSIRFTFLLSIIVFFLSIKGNAQSYSYLFIQGDKKTPFYVKKEGEMMPRYGKNYSIVSRLKGGELRIQLLFQQNEFPPEDFIILIPENGSRSFLLTQKEDEFLLFDLQQKFYLSPGNTAADDRLPNAFRETVAGSAKMPETQPAIQQEPVVGNTAKKAVEKRVEIEQPAKQEIEQEPKEKKSIFISNGTPTSASEKINNEPRFLDNIELNKVTPDNSLPVKNDTETKPTNSNWDTETQPLLRNSDCPVAMEENEFSRFYSSFTSTADEEERLAILIKEIPSNCFFTWQARTLANALSGDAARFSLLKNIYPRISDQIQFHLLDDLLTTDVWKEAFQQLISPR